MRAPGRPRATRGAGSWSRSCDARAPAGWQWRWQRTATRITWAACPRWWKRSIPGACWHPARAGDRIELDGVALEVLSPDSLWMTLPLDVNEHGVVLRVSYGAVRLLFQADAGLPV